MNAAIVAKSPGLGAAIASVVRHRWARVAGLVWIVATAAAWWLADGFLPFDRPAMARLPFAQQMLMPTLGLIEIFLLMAITFGLTRRRTVPDLAARAPERAVARRETIAILAYAGAAQVGGWLLGPALGYRPFSFHIAGTLVGCSVPPSAGEIWVWAIYNFIAFAVVPFAWFRRRYSSTQLNLRSTDRSNDLLVIVVIAAIESAVELIAVSPAILSLPPRQLLLGGAATFAIYFIGTVLPTMVLIYAILLPRYLKLTGSPVATVILGGLTYAAVHLVEGWSAFGSARDTILSILFVFFGYFGPGMIKSVLTLRTGNAWVHAIGYHAIAPHALIDTPLISKALGVR